MDSQDSRLAPPLALERQMLLPAQGPEVVPAGEPARAEVSRQVAPETAGRAAALPLLLVALVPLLSPFIHDLLLRLWALLH